MRALCHTIDHLPTVDYTPRESSTTIHQQMGERPMPHIQLALQTTYPLGFTYKSSICTGIQETNFKILTRWYNTPAKLHRVFPSTSDHCWRCQEEQGILLHIFWNCPKLEQLWKEVCLIAQKFTERPFSDDPAFFLFHASNIPGKI